MATETLTQAAKAHWRALWPAWVLPIFFYVGALTSESLGRFDFFLFAIAMPLFVVAYLWALRPWTNGRIANWHGIFWLIIVPGVISLVCVLAGSWIIQAVGENGLAS